jgi:hypothetical protein
MRPHLGFVGGALVRSPSPMRFTCKNAESRWIRPGRRRGKAHRCLSLLFFQFSFTAYAAAGETSRAMRLALLISATRRS